MRVLPGRCLARLAFVTQVPRPVTGRPVRVALAGAGPGQLLLIRAGVDAAPILGGGALRGQRAAALPSNASSSSQHAR